MLCVRNPVEVEMRLRELKLWRGSALRIARSGAALLAGVLLSALVPGIDLVAWADEPDPYADAVILVATDNLTDPTYWHTVLVSRPTGAGRHVGVILNRPTDTSLARLFPAHEASRKVQETVFFGGPMTPDLLSAAVRSAQSDDEGVIAFGNDLSLVLKVDAIDAIIEQHPNDARYYVGKVLWRPGELKQEMARGFWKVLPISSEIVFRKEIASLWNELNAAVSMLSASRDAAVDELVLAMSAH
jgi:putative AlgH/UPF0301 family transcriptional regulator